MIYCPLNYSRYGFSLASSKFHFSSFQFFSSIGDAHWCDWQLLLWTIASYPHVSKMVLSSLPESGSNGSLRGLLKLISSQCPDEVEVFNHDSQTLEKTSVTMQHRRRRQIRTHVHAERQNFECFANQHRYVCFFAIQGNRSNFYSAHSLALRKLLAGNYHDVMSTFLLFLGDVDDPSSNLFGLGTGFAVLPPSTVVMSLLNIQELPALVIIDRTTGAKISRDAALALEWNNPQDVINSWQRGRSGLSCTQKLLALSTFQSDCSIMWCVSSKFDNEL